MGKLRDTADGQAQQGELDSNLAAILFGFNGTALDRLRSVGDNADALSPVALGILRILSAGMVFTGAGFDRLRDSNVFKSFASTAITAGTGMTAWTPTAGKKFRFMGYAISSSAAGVLIFGDNLVGTVIHRHGAVAAAGVAVIERLGNGILSAAANNLLKLDGPTGNVAGAVWGTEE